MPQTVRPLASNSSRAKTHSLLVLVAFTLIFLQFPTLFLQALPSEESVFVERVIDGDTVILADGRRVRLIGVDAPEINHLEFRKLGEPFGDESHRALNKLVDDHRVILRQGPDEKDKYDRQLSYIYLEDGTFVNEEMIRLGFAEAYRRFDHPYRARFIEVEKEAKRLQKGMWRETKESSWQRFWRKLYEH